LLEEIIVTAQKREQNLQNVPVAVSAFSSELLQQAGVRDMYELATLSPSLSVDTSQSAVATTFAIRGIFTSSLNFALEPSVGLYVDRVYRSRQGSMINNLVDIAMAEVLRGPQGALFGRNTPAGAVLISSVRPDHEGSGFLEAEAGDYDLLNISGARSVSLIQDELAMRFTGFWMERDGTVDAVGQNVQQDEALNDRDRYGGRFQTEYTPADDLSVVFTADYSEIDEICCATGVWKNNVVGAGGVPGTDSRIEGLGGTLLLGADFYDREVATSSLPQSRNEDKGVSLQIDWEHDDYLLTSITAYREHNSNDNVDADFIDVDSLHRIDDANQDQFSQELQISAEGETFDYLAGLYYYRQNLDSHSDTIPGEDAAGLLGLGNITPEPFPVGSNALNVAEQEHESYAIYGQVDYNLSDSLVLTAGLRWTFEDKDLTSTFSENGASSTPLPTEPGWGFWLFDPLRPRPDAEEKMDDDRVTGSLKLSWFMNDTTMFYASYGTGYKSGGLNTDRISPALPLTFEPEESDSYELGVKADFPEQSLRVNVALHRTDTDDLQTVSFQGTAIVLVNAGTAETYGGELDIQWLPADKTTLTLAYAYNHGEYSDFTPAPCWVGTPFHTGEPDPGDNGDGTCDRSGGDISSNAENAVSATANQDFDVAEGITAFAYGEYAWKDGRMTDVNNDPGKRDGSFFTLNLRAGLYFEDYRTRVTLWGRNVTDEEYTNTIADAVAQAGRFIAFYPEPFTWGVNIRRDF